jgi:uncharacterized protein DUF2800
VFAYFNEQLLLYALGAWHNLIVPLGYEIDTVRMVIHQPRLNHYDVWEISLHSLIVWANYFKEAAARTRDPKAIAVAGEEQCQWCGVNGTCKVRAASVVETVFEPASDADFPDLTSPRIADFLTNDEIGQLMPKLDFIQKWCTSIYAVADRRLAAGQKIPGYKMVQGKMGARSWIDSDQAVSRLLELGLSPDVAFKITPISPIQAEKELSKEQYAQLKPFVTQSQGKPAVVPDSDKRPPLVLGVSDDEFEAV